MAAQWPALARVALLACCAVPLLLAAADGGDVPRPQPPWCLRKECECVAGAEPADEHGQWQQRVSVRCTFSGDKAVIWEQDNSNKSLVRSLVELELIGDGQSKLTISSRTFVTFVRLRSLTVSGFAEVTVRRQGLQIRGQTDSNFTVTVNRVQRLYLDTNAVQPMSGTVDVTVQDCDSVRLSNEVVTRLRSFALRRIGTLELSENTFKNAAEGSTIERMLLEDLTADKLPSHAFITTIDHLSIADCTFGAIEKKAFPVNSMMNMTLTNVTVDRVESGAFQQTALIFNLRIIGCRVREMQREAIMSVIQSIVIERSRFEWVRTSAVSVANELTLFNNTFDGVDGRGFVLHSLHSVKVDGNTFGRLDADAFYEQSTAARQGRSVLRVRDNVFQQRTTDGGPLWTPAVRLQSPAAESDVAGNRFVGRCGCGPWRFVATSAAAGDRGADDYAGQGQDEAEAAAAAAAAAADAEDDDDEFADRNYCRPGEAGAACANLTAEHGDRDMRIDEFVKRAGCDRDAGAYAACLTGRVADNAAAAAAADGGAFSWLGFAWTERGVTSTVMLLVMCGFGTVCAVSAVTWLNARGYFIKLRSLLTSCGGSRGGGGLGGGGGHGGGCGSDGGMMSRTVSAHSLSPVSVHEYAKLRRPKLGGSGDLSLAADTGVRVVVYQDKGTQTVPEELTHEMLQTLRDKLDDPDDYAEARGLIEHLYDLIRVEETCCGVGAGGAGNWYTPGGGLDDMTSTITTKAVTAAGTRGRDVVSVGTGVPSLDRLWPSRIGGPPNPQSQSQSQQPPPPPPPDRRPKQPTPSPLSADRRPRARPSVRDEYMVPADLLYGGRHAPLAGDDDDDDVDIYCELADLRPDDRRSRPAQPLPPVPDKPTRV